MAQDPPIASVGVAAQHGGRRRDIQGLRAVAVAVVVAFHMGLPVPGGFVGVDVFFVISGFVITAMLHREWVTHGRVQLGRFYLRRFKRLTPALALLVTVTSIASVLLLSPLGVAQTALKTALGAMTLAANFVISMTTGGYFDAPAETNPLLNTWSLSVEEQFYLVFPAVALLGWLLARRRRALAGSPYVLITVIAIASFALAVAGSRGWLPGAGTFVSGFYSPFTRVWEFAAGSLLALALVRPRAWILKASPFMGVAGAALIGGALWFITDATPFPGLWTLLPVVGTLLVLLAGAGSGGPVTALLSTRPMVRAGDLSYSIYLWHWPFIVFAFLLLPSTPVVAAVAVGISLVVSIGSYTWVERPLRLRPLGGTSEASRFIAVVVGIPLITAGVLYLGARAGFGLPVFEAATAARNMHAAQLANCRVFIADGVPENCAWNIDAPGRPIYVVGDSNADQFSEGLMSAAEKLNRPIYQSDGCRFVDISTSNVAGDEQWNVNCRSNVHRLTTWLGQQPEGTVVIANSDSYWTDTQGRPGYSGWSAGPTADHLSTSPTDRVRFFESALGRTVRTLRAQGHDVVLVQTVPHFEEPPQPFNPDRCTLWTVISGGCWPTASLSSMERLQGPVRAAMNRVAAAEGASVIDFRPEFCDESTCYTRRGGRILYLDGHHISVAASKELADQWVGELRGKE